VTGSPDDCVAQILDLQSRLKVTYLILRIPRIGLSQGLSLDAIRLFGESVLPRLRFS